MRHFGKYTLHLDIGVSGNCVLYTATESLHGRTVLLKILMQNAQDIEERAKIRHEFHLLQRLSQTTHFCLTPLDLVEDGDYIGSVFTYDAFKDLYSLYPRTALPIDAFFPLAITITRALDEIHREGIIHKNLALKNIWYQPEEKHIKITEFIIATEVNRSMVASVPPRLLQGVLQYIAPEQTGRMNRPITSQTDLYSLGIIFYELLAGRVPFDHQRPMQIVIDHVSTLPPPLHELNPEIPKILSQIVSKLLAKMAENRYQTANGLLLDLEHVWDALKDKKEIAPFVLDQHSKKKKLELSGKIYGHASLIDELFQIFDGVYNNKNKATIVIHGHSGAGKTSIVNELSRKLAVTDGFFAAGKFDKFQKSDSYEGLRNALDSLVQYKLYVPEDEYQQFKNDVINEVGVVLRVMTDFIPRLKEIVGTPPPLPVVGIEQTKNRFRLAIHRFIKAATLHHPMVLFLDDLQWANQSLFSLLSTLILSEDFKNILFIVSYRSDEVDVYHPLSQTLDIIQQKEVFQDISVEGLEEETLVELLHDVLFLPRQDVMWLAKFLWEISSGNPLFLVMLLDALHEDNALYFSPQSHQWCWNEEKIDAFKDVREISIFVDNQISKIPPEVKEILHTASCIGNHFTLEELAFANKATVHQVLDDLSLAISAQLIVPLDIHYDWLSELPEEVLRQRKYRFHHDKIQHACYRLKSGEKTEKTHLKIARNWYAAYGKNCASIRLLAIVDQFNKGITHIQSVDEKEDLCRLNYAASQIASESVAYETAYDYDSMSKSLLLQNIWQEDYHFAFQVFLSYIKSAFLTHHFIESDIASEELLKNTDSVIDKAKILALKGNLGRVSGHTRNSLLYFEEGLYLLGYGKVAHKPSYFEILKATTIFKMNLHNQKIPLENLPENTPEIEELAFILAVHLAEECYYSGDMLRYVYALMTWGSLSFSHHNRELRAACYIMNSMISPRNRFAHTLYSKAIKLLTTAKNHEQAALFYCAGTLLHNCWYTPWNTIMPNLQESIEMSAKAGNLEFLAYSYIFHAYFPPNLSCDTIVMRYTQLRTLVTDISPRATILLLSYNQYYRQLMGATEVNNWKDSWINETEINAFCEKANFIVGHVSIAIFKLRSAVYFDDVSTIEKTRNTVLFYLEHIERGGYAYNIALSYFNIFLADIQSYAQASLKEKFIMRFRMLKLYHRIRRFVKLCPHNFSHLVLFMSAEYARFHGHFKKALRLYNMAIQSATEHEMPEYIGLANQRAADYCVARKKNDLAQSYMDAAIKVYEDWHAVGKIKQLREKYPELVK